MGGARSGGDLGGDAGGGRGGAGRGRAWTRATSRRSASPTSARRPCCGSAPPAGRSTTRWSGRIRASIRWSPRWRATAGRIASARRRACRWQAISARSSCAGCSTTCAERASRAEAGELMFGTIDTWLLVEPRRAARHRRDQREPHAVDEPAHADLGRCAAGGVRHPARGAARDRAVVGVLGEARGVLAGVPVAGVLGDQQAALFGQTLLRARRGEEHIRDGLLPADEHRHRCRSRPSHGLITTVAYKCGGEPSRSMRWRARSPSPARWCSGCATISA